MKMNKILAAMAATVVSVSSMAVMSLSASADDERKDSYNFALEGTFGAATDWTGKYSVDVTADGTYTIDWAAPDAGEAGNPILLIQSDVPVYAYGNDQGDNGATNGALSITIDKITADGVELAYTRSDNAQTTDDAGTMLRLNIYNEWAPVKDIPTDWTVTDTLSVTFTVSGLFPDAADPTTEAPTTTTAADNNSTATTTAAGATTTKADDKAAATTTKAAATTAKPAATTAKPAASEASASTGDAGVGVVFTVIAAAGAAAFVSRKKN